MSKFVKKPIIIEAVQYLEYGKLVKGMCNSRSCYRDGNTSPHVHTIHKSQIVNLEIGDFIIPEPDGIHYYPCKPDIFYNTYSELVDSPVIFNEIMENYPDEEFLFPTGFETAIIGVEVPSMRLIISAQKCIELLIDEETNEEDANEHYDFNVVGSYMGEKTPIFMEDRWQM